MKEKKEIQELEHTVQKLEFEDEELEQKLRIANEISQYCVILQIKIFTSKALSPPQKLNFKALPLFVFAYH